MNRTHRMIQPEIDPPLPPNDRLPRSFYRRSPQEVARRLIGQALLSRIPTANAAEGKDDNSVLCGGWIVEAEAYLSVGDPASHSAVGPTKRNASMFAEPGVLYVYTIHTHHCLNAVTEQFGTGSAVLIRAVEPVWGIDLMRQRRGRGHDLRQLCRGPGRLCRSLGIDKRHDGIDLASDASVWIAPWKHPRRVRCSAGSRIGISKAQEMPLRFFVDQNRYVSGRGTDHSERPRQSLLLASQRSGNF